MYAGDPDFVDDDVQTEEEEHAAWLYTECLEDGDWIRTRLLAVQGTRFAHEKHVQDIATGIQHKLFAKLCEARRPCERCPCGLYALTWLDA